ncbi:hypothetical protein RIR_jg26081.t1 [Rhizophagus irregularis DAOM 181602=DAOM 197198]|nr:hypothetical protein RIR_jg26081.t1 [Rhizophagus irregularis DAOM 181602=DAOM 197198]
MLMSYWAPSLSNSRPHDGVGLLLHHPLHKHVQKIDPWNGQRDAIFAQLNSWLDKARSNNYHVVILGDFNADEVSHSHLSQHHLKIL